MEKNYKLEFHMDNGSVISFVTKKLKEEVLCKVLDVAYDAFAEGKNGVLNFLSFDDKKYIIRVSKIVYFTFKESR